MALAQCASCNMLLMKPYIRCAQCTTPAVELCLYCFGGGFEGNNHKSDHMYEVIKDDFTLFEHSWSAGEEITLLDAVAECGVGNWSEVCERMQHRTAEECEKHYSECYLVKPEPPLPNMPCAELTYFPCPMPFKVCQAPPRPAEDSTLQIEMSGYCAARSEFAVEHNNFAELDIKDVSLTDNDGSLDTELQLAMLRIYRSILKERHRRKFIVRQFGLIDVPAHQGYIRRCEQVLSTKTVDTLRHLSSFFIKQPLLWDFVIEALSLEAALRRRITDLQKYREGGLRWMRSARVYDKSSALQRAGQPHLLNDVLRYIRDSYQCQPWLQQKIVFDKLSKSINISRPASVRRSSAALDIVGLPGYERLAETEKQLCSQVRLVPESYLEYKNLLMNECNKLGRLRLAQARTLLKIDVNKTRKVYDFLVSQHIIKTDRNTVPDTASLTS